MDRLFVTLYLFGLVLLYIQNETAFPSSSTCDGKDIEAKANEIFDNCDFFRYRSETSLLYLEKFMSKRNEEVYYKILNIEAKRRKVNLKLWI